MGGVYTRAAGVQSSMFSVSKRGESKNSRRLMPKPCASCQSKRELTEAFFRLRMLLMVDCGTPEALNSLYCVMPLSRSSSSMRAAIASDKVMITCLYVISIKFCGKNILIVRVALYNDEVKILSCFR